MCVCDLITVLQIAVQQCFLCTTNILASDADHFRWQNCLLGLKDHQGNTALHLAVMEGSTESVQLLLQASANTETPGALTDCLLWAYDTRYIQAVCQFVIARPSFLLHHRAADG